MSPTLRPGDLLLVRARAHARSGRVAVVRLPRDHDGMPRPLAVKRLAHPDPHDPARWWLERDNPAVGVDSWSVGSIPAADVLGVAVIRLWPRPRRL